MRRPEPTKHVHDPIDVLVVDPIASDARRTSQALRRSTPSISIVRVMHTDQALRLMFDRGLFTATPQLPGLILLDIVLADSKALLKRICTDEQTRDIPVVVLSTRREPSDIAEFCSLGAVAYVVKPDDPVAYEASIADILSNWLDCAADHSSNIYRGTLSTRGSCSERDRNSFSHAHASNRCSSHRAITRRRTKDSHRHQA